MKLSPWQRFAVGVAGIALAGFIVFQAFEAQGVDRHSEKHRGESTSTASQRPAEQASFEHFAFDRLLKQYVDGDGWVDYRGLARERAALDSYLTRLATAAPHQFSSDAERLAFWINAYNALTLADVLDRVYGKARGVKEVDGFFDKKRHRIAGEELTLDEIETRGRSLRDPRLHFAIVCASASCPKLQRFAYAGDKLNAQLDQAAREFLGDSSRGLRLDRDNNQILLSSIFKWYAGDFLGAAGRGDRILARVKAAISGGEIREYVKQYSPPEAARFIEERRPAVRYVDYDWSLNAQEMHRRTEQSR